MQSKVEKDHRKETSKSTGKMQDEPEQDEDSASTNQDPATANTPDVLEGAYDASKYELPNVSSQMKNLLAFITHYSPQTIEIGPRLKPFIPDYIPTVGHVDAFIKIPYPDSRTNQLGLIVLDEPSIEQSDATLLLMKLKALSKQINQSIEGDKTARAGNSVNSGPFSLTTSNVGVDVPLVNANALVKEIDKWVESVQLLHETTDRPESVALMHQRPDHHNIDNLMQEWPEQLETTLNVHSLPTADLDCTLDEYMAIMCAILDIPIQNSKIASLYLIFTLLNEFQNSQHFNKYGDQ